MNAKHWTVSLVAASACALIGTVVCVQPAAAAVVKRELIVKLRTSIAPAGLRMERIAERPNLHLIKLPDTADFAATLQKLRADPAVEFAEPNYVVRAFDNGVPDDPLFSKQWSLQNTGQADKSGQTGTPGADIRVGPVWARGIKGDRRVLVAVIDSGVNFAHPDLVENIYTNPGEVAANGIDDDRNGYIDDVHGWNTYDDSGNSMDDFGHGTHCAGIIGATGRNALGITGINHEVSILPLKFLPKYGGGTILGAIKAIEYARKMNVKIMSNSWGGNEFSQALKEAIQDAQREGILFVAAVGNSATDVGASPTYPAGYDLPNILAVAATDNRDHLSAFSNYGNTVHLAAPGVDIISTFGLDRYKAWSGTSMAAPHVAGVAALLASVRGDFDAEQIRELLVATSDPIHLPAGKQLIGGRVNALRAILGQ